MLDKSQRENDPRKDSNESYIELEKFKKLILPLLQVQQDDGRVANDPFDEPIVEN